MSTYTVKSGDRLSEIARQLGVKTSDISGYKSGDPNLIYAGETLNVGGKKPTGYITDVMGTGLLNNPKPTTTKTSSSAKDYFGLGDGKSEGDTRVSGGVTQRLLPDGTWSNSGGTTTPTKAPAPIATTTQPKPTTDDYRAALTTATPTKEPTDDYSAKRDAAYKDMQGARSKAYESAYKDKGMERIKDDVSALDTQIGQVRDAMNESVLKTRQNPYLSASALAGDVSKITDKYQADINNLVQQRNALAGQYNTGLSEIETEVENTLSDKAMELQYWDGLIKAQAEAESAQQKALIDQLKMDTQSSQFDRQLAQALQIAQMRNADGGSSNSYTLTTDPYGNPLYWVDKRNQQIIPVEGDTTSMGGDSTYADMLEQMKTQPTQDEGWWSKLKNWWSGNE